MEISREYIGNALFALILLILLSPFLLIVIVLIATERQQIFFFQERIGKSGQHFRMIKFRTINNSSVQNSEISDTKIKAGKSKLGSILRSYRIDELPQLVNVLKGDMNIVGCRPVIPEIYNTVKKQVPDYDIRHKYKPGITGYAQVKMGYAATIEEETEKFKYDKYYTENRYVWLDIKILVLTVVTILGGNGH